MSSTADARSTDMQQRHIAGALAEYGLTRGDRLVLRLDGSLNYVLTVLAAARSGVVPVPLDPRLTEHEARSIIDDVEPALVIDTADALDGLLNGPPAELAPYPLCRPMHFTSGTTGKPKGVWSGLLSHEQAAALALEERDLWGFHDADVNLVVSPIYHSAPLRFAMGTLLAGGQIHVVAKFTPEGFADAVRAHRPTTLFCVPAHLQRLFAWLDDHATSIDVSSFRLVAHAGAACPDSIRRRAHELFGVDTVWEFYGSTEGQFTACPATEWVRRPGTLGRARPGRIMSVDDDGQLWCTVPDYARFTYWRAPEKTASAWKQTPDGPAFTVGDLGRIDDGYVYLDSRREDLIITGGVNVYPAEVEAALEDVDGIDDIAVFARADDQWGHKVCAAYVGTADEGALRRRAEEQLAPPKRPKEYVRLDALPRTATGKVQRTALS